MVWEGGVSQHNNQCGSVMKVCERCESDQQRFVKGQSTHALEPRQCQPAHKCHSSGVIQWLLNRHIIV